MRQYKKGMVYWVMGFTAPKVFDGEKFHCLLTDQVIENGEFRSAKKIGPLADWCSPVYKPERFESLMERITSGKI